MAKQMEFASWASRYDTTMQGLLRAIMATGQVDEITMLAIKALESAEA